MFTGIVETIGEIVSLTNEEGNVHLTIKADFADELQVDQSISHNGVCLTVVDVGRKTYTVTAISETLKKSNLGTLEVGGSVNLERGMKLGDRLDGHIVQGHVDQTGVCEQVTKKDGSWEYLFHFDPNLGNITVEKGSITVNGVSLTVVQSQKGIFSVAIIPYTYEHTNFHSIEKGTLVNLEFDVIGKYVRRLTEGYF